MNSGYFQNGLKIKRRQDAPEGLGQHCFAGAGRTEHRDIVTAGGGDFQTAFGRRLTADFGKIRAVFLTPINNLGRRRRRQLRSDHRLAGFGIVKRREVETKRPQTSDAENGEAANERRFGGVRRRQIQFANPRLFGPTGNHQSAADGADTAVQRQFANEQFVFGVKINRLGRPQVGQSNRQIKRRPLLLEVGRRQRDNHFLVAFLRRGKTGIFNRRGDAVLGLLHRFVRQTDDIERVEAFGDVHLHFHDVGLESDHLSGGDSRQHIKPPSD